MQGHSNVFTFSIYKIMTHMALQKVTTKYKFI